MISTTHPSNSRVKRIAWLVSASPAAWVSTGQASTHETAVHALGKIDVEALEKTELFLLAHLDANDVDGTGALAGLAAGAGEDVHLEQPAEPRGDHLASPAAGYDRGTGR